MDLDKGHRRWRRFTRLATLAGLMWSWSSPVTAQGRDTTMQALTPVLFVEEIEPCLEFWVERLGFAKQDEVTEGDRLGFVTLVRDGTQLMYQTRASITKDLPALAQGPFERTGLSLFVRVRHLDGIAAGLEGVEFIFPERKTFYGSREIGVRAPCGTAVIFAEFAESGSS